MMKPDTEKLKSALLNLTNTNTMIPIHMEIEGQAFFPGGRGLWRDDDQCISNKKVMIVGQDFDTITAYKKAVELKREPIDSNKTWVNLRQFLKEVGIDLNDCFFTNAIMGARKDGSNSGLSPAWKDAEYIDACRKFFLKQIEVCKPNLILVLGRMPAKILGALSDDLTCWNSSISLSKIDEKGEQFKYGATFKNGLISDIIILTHPSFRFANVFRRKYGRWNGHDAEIRMVKEALKIE